MSVRAKFKCVSVLRSKDYATVLLEPVVSGSKENESFYRWTPGGKVELSTINHDAANQFIPGCDYYLDFTLDEPKPA